MACAEYTETRTIISYNHWRPCSAAGGYPRCWKSFDERIHEEEAVKWRNRVERTDLDKCRSEDSDFYYFDSNRAELMLPYLPEDDYDEQLTYGERCSTLKNDLGDGEDHQEKLFSNSRPNIFISAANGCPVYIYASGEVQNRSPENNYDRYNNSFNGCDKVNSRFAPPARNGNLNYSEPNQAPLHSSGISRSQNWGSNDGVIGEKPKSTKRVTFEPPALLEHDNSNFNEQTWTPHPPSNSAPNRSFTTYRSSFDPAFRHEEVGLG